MQGWGPATDKQATGQRPLPSHAGCRLQPENCRLPAACASQGGRVPEEGECEAAKVGAAASAAHQQVGCLPQHGPAGGVVVRVGGVHDAEVGGLHDAGLRPAHEPPITMLPSSCTARARLCGHRAPQPPHTAVSLQTQPPPQAQHGAAAAPCANALPGCKCPSVCKCTSRPARPPRSQLLQRLLADHRRGPGQPPPRPRCGGQGERGAAGAGSGRGRQGRRRRGSRAGHQPAAATKPQPRGHSCRELQGGRPPAGAAAACLPNYPQPAAAACLLPHPQPAGGAPDGDAQGAAGVGVLGQDVAPRLRVGGRGPLSRLSPPCPAPGSPPAGPAARPACCRALHAAQPACCPRGPRRAAPPG